MFLKTVCELTLRVLWRFTGLLETGFLALDCTRVTSQEACFLQRATVVLAIDFVQCTSDTQANGTGLAGWSATVNQSDDVVGAFELEYTEWVVNFLLVQFVREVRVEFTAVDLPGTSTWNQADASDGAFATTNGLTGLGQCRTFGRFFSSYGGIRFRGVAGQLLVLSDLIDVFSHGFSLNSGPTGQPGR